MVDDLNEFLELTRGLSSVMTSDQTITMLQSFFAIFIHSLFVNGYPTEVVMSKFMKLVDNFIDTLSYTLEPKHYSHMTRQVFVNSFPVVFPTKDGRGTVLAVSPYQVATVLGGTSNQRLVKVGYAMGIL